MAKHSFLQLERLRHVKRLLGQLNNDNKKKKKAEKKHIDKNEQSEFKSEMV